MVKIDHTLDYKVLEPFHFALAGSARWIASGHRRPRFPIEVRLESEPYFPQARHVKVVSRSQSRTSSGHWSALEIERVCALVSEILQVDTSWVDRHGVEAPLKLHDILIIAPYNAQVFALQERLPSAYIGTVDKFQGQEAPIVIYTMTTSSHADAPRGMEFLYSANRLNVATSRAKCMCIIVASPTLFEAECRTPRQMQLANAFCRYLKMATAI